MIVKVLKSPRKMKRFRVLMDNGKTFDFGLEGGQTYIDHGDKKLRENYIKRHLANATEARLIENLVPSPALFSRILLWGPYQTLDENVNYLNQLWAKKKA